MLNTTKLLLNEQIKFESVRVIDSNGTQHGIMPSEAAYRLALNENKDLVLVSPEANPPVCKIVDWGKHLYELKKRAKESKAKQTVIDTKEIQLRPTTDSHDIETKMNQVRKFLDKGKHVRFHMRFRGREASHAEIGMTMMNDILEKLGDSVNIDKKPVLNGKNIIMIVSPQTK